MTNSHASWDVVIAGAGLAGLSMAVELAQPQFVHLRVLLVEPRANYVRDRTWSYWGLPNAVPARWRQLASMQWPRWRVSLEERSVISRSQLPYVSVRADTFYEAALDVIAKAPHIHWRRETAVAQTQSTADGVDLITQAGQSLQAHLLFDSRPPQVISKAEWVQHFTGWEVQTDQPCFDVQSVDLMDFVPRKEGLHFFYCLPFSQTQALIESTWISRASHEVDAEAELRQALHQRLRGVGYSILFREQGALPLIPKLAAAQPHIVQIGRAGGTLRAATGYAFCATLQQTSALAASLATHLSSHALNDWQAPVQKTHRMDAWMDQVLFRVLERDWERAPCYFLSLFERVPESSLIRFLQGQATWHDRLAVMRALPSLPFMKAALG